MDEVKELHMYFEMKTAGEAMSAVKLHKGDEVNGSAA